MQNVRRNVRAAAASAIESLEGRRLLATFAPINLVGLWDDTQNFGNARRALSFYDATNTPTSGSNTGHFNQNPLFSVWTGYEDTGGRGNEELAAFDVDEVSGKAYVLSYDSTASGTNTVGDTGSDYDIYRIDLRAIYDDYVTNSRPRGIMYAPAVSSDGFDYLGAYGSASPAVDELNQGVPIGRSNVDSDTRNDIIFFAGSVAKVGEVPRRAAATSPSNFNQQTIEVVNDTTIILLENKADTLTSGAEDRDYTIRTLERVSTTPGLAQYRAATDDGGYNGNPALPANARPTESWEAKVWTGDNALKMDTELSPGTRDYSEVDQMVYVARDGVQGVWISERDGNAGSGGDDFSFFKLDFTTRTAQKQDLRTTGAAVDAFSLDENPVVNANTNDGDVDWFQVDSGGNLVIVEAGYDDATKHQSKVITRAVTNYAAADTDGDGISEVSFGAWGVVGPITPTVNEPTDDPIVGTFLGLGAYVAATNRIYFFDADSTGGTFPVSTTDVVSDVYVLNVATGVLEYQELNAVNHFILNAARNRGFTLTSGADAVAPTVTQTYAFQTEQSITFTFSEALATSGAGAFSAADITLTNTTTSTVIPTADLTLVDLGNNVYKLTYKAGATTNPLPRGAYTLTLNAAGVTDVAGNALAAPTVLNFKVNPGDTNQDGDVDFDDLLVLAQNYGTSGKTYSQGNLNYDAAGNVNFDDLLLLAQNYGTTVTAAVRATPVQNATAAKRKTVSADVLG